MRGKFSIAIGGWSWVDHQYCTSSVALDFFTKVMSTAATAKPYIKKQVFLEQASHTRGGLSECRGAPVYVVIAFVIFFFSSVMGERQILRYSIH